MDFGSFISALISLVVAFSAIWLFKKKRKKSYLVLSGVIFIGAISHLILAIYGHDDGTYTSKAINGLHTDWYMLDAKHSTCYNLGASSGNIYQPSGVEKKYGCSDVSTKGEKINHIVHLNCENRLKAHLFFAKGRKNCLFWASQFHNAIEKADLYHSNG